MKKIFSALSVIFVFFALAVPALAVITPEEAMSETYIQGHGYSDEMARLVDLQNAQINCTQTKHKGDRPDIYNDKKVNFIRQIFKYLDCGLDDEKFMQHNTKFTTRYDDL